MKYLVIIILCMLSQTAAATQIYGFQDDLSQMGRGFDTDSQRARGNCLDGSVEDGPPNRQVQFRTYVEESSENILDQESGSGSASVNLWVVGGKAKSEFILRNSETNLQTSVLWSIDYRGGSKVFSKHRLNTMGRKAVSLAPDGRRERCGDTFVGTAIMGAKVLLSASLIFTSEENYRYFKTKVSASAFGGLVKKSKTAVDEVRQIAKGAFFSVQFYQYGGNSFDAELIQASGPSICKVEDIDRCLDKFQALHDYTFGEKGFRASFGGSGGNLKPLYMEAYTYGDSGYSELDSPPDQDIKSEFSTISEGLFTLGSGIQTQIALLAARLSSATPAEVKELQLKMDELQRRYSDVKAVADLCRTAVDFATCKQRFEEIAK